MLWGVRSSEIYAHSCCLVHRDRFVFNPSLRLASLKVVAGVRELCMAVNTGQLTRRVIVMVPSGRHMPGTLKLGSTLGMMSPISPH